MTTRHLMPEDTWVKCLTCKKIMRNTRDPKFQYVTPCRRCGHDLAVYEEHA